MYIYLVTNKTNNKKYVGQTIHDVEIRWQKHLCAGTALYNAIKKYGKDSFQIEVIDTATTLKNLNEKEIQWIKKLNTLAPNGYNLEDGGKNIGKPCEETLKRLSESHKGKTPSKDTRKKMSSSQKLAQTRKEVVEAKRERMLGNTYTLGVEPWNKGTKGVMTAWNKGRKGLNSGEHNPFYGKKHTKEVRQKMSENSWMRNIDPSQHPQAIPVVVYGIRYPTKKQACEALGWSLWKFNKYYKAGVLA